MIDSNGDLKLGAGFIQQLNYETTVFWPLPFFRENEGFFCTSVITCFKDSGN